MPDELLERLHRFQVEAFALQRAHFKLLVDDGQQPLTLFILETAVDRFPAQETPHGH